MEGQGWIFIGVRLVEVLWKMGLVILDFCLGASIVIHDVIFKFRDGDGMGTAYL